MVLQGAGILSLPMVLNADCLRGLPNIPAHCKHRVAWTDPDQVTVGCVFYRWGQ